MRRPTILVLLALFGALSGCQTNKRTGRSQLKLYSDDQMTAMGQQAYLEMTGPQSDAKIETDPRLVAPLQRVGQALSAAADKPEWDGQWEFKLIRDNKTVNAWALPGGKIAFYTAIYPILKDENGLAIVMGHEIMHAILDHGNERVSQGQLVAVGVTAAAVAAEFSDYEYKRELIAALGAGVAVGVLLPYSRLHETEADEYGLYLAASAGYDPEAAIGVWQRMADLSSSRPPEFLSTHPDPLHRIENMKKWMPKAKDIYARSVKHRNRPLPPVR